MNVSLTDPTRMEAPSTSRAAESTRRSDTNVPFLLSRSSIVASVPAIELCVSSAIDLAYASGADGRQDFVTADSLSRSQGHGAGSREWRPFYAAATVTDPTGLLPISCRTPATSSRTMGTIRA